MLTAYVIPPTIRRIIFLAVSVQPKVLGVVCSEVSRRVFNVSVLTFSQHISWFQLCLMQAKQIYKANQSEDGRKVDCRSVDGLQKIPLVNK